jgi:VanZ family protein
MKFPTNMTTEKLLSAFLRAAFIGCVIALAILAWMPAKAMTRTILGGHAEHFIAYLGTAVVMGLAYRKRPLLAVQCTLLIMYAALLEAGQVYSPDRHPSFEDLAFSSAGVVVGGLFLRMARDRMLGWLRIDYPPAARQSRTRVGTY